MASENDVPGDAAAPESWFILRPPTVLMDLPYAFRWEVTRRHPYYLRFWGLAQRHHERPSSDPQQRDLERAATLVLLAIGISGSPPHPGASPESLGAGALSQGWESGAVAPITFRGLIGMLLSDLPPDLLHQVSQLLAEAATAVG